MSLYTAEYKCCCTLQSRNVAVRYEVVLLLYTAKQYTLSLCTANWYTLLLWAARRYTMLLYTAKSYTMLLYTANSYTPLMYTANSYTLLMYAASDTRFRCDTVVVHCKRLKRTLIWIWQSKTCKCSIQAPLSSKKQTETIPTNGTHTLVVHCKVIQSYLYCTP